MKIYTALSFEISIFAQSHVFCLRVYMFVSLNALQPEFTVHYTQLMLACCN